MSSILSNFTDHKASKIREAFDSVGLPHSKPTINSGNRTLIRGFLNGLGFETNTYIGLTCDELQAIYHDIARTSLKLVPLIMAATGGAANVEEVAETLVTCYQRIRSTSSACFSYSAIADATAIQEEINSWIDSSKGNAKAVTATQEAKQEAGNVSNAVPASVPASDASMSPQDAASAIAKILENITGNAKAAPLDEGKVIELIKAHSMATTIKLVTDKDAKEIKVGLHHKILSLVIKYLQAGKARGKLMPLFLVGPAGSGKTTIAEQASEVLGVPFFFNGALDSEYKLTGFIDAQGRVICPAFRKAYENGGVYLFDEVDGSLPSALLAFNAALSNGHMDFPDGCVKCHPDFYCLAAANTYGKGADRQYVGRNQLDAASLDRFVVIAVDYDEANARIIAAALYLLEGAELVKAEWDALGREMTESQALQKLFDAIAKARGE